MKTLAPKICPNLAFMFACSLWIVLGFGQIGMTVNAPVEDPPMEPLYNATNDFSIVSNPNGAWSYGYIATLDGPFQVLPVARDNEVPEFGILSWSLTGFSSPDFHYNSSDKTFVAWGRTGVFPPKTLWMCPGPEGRPENFGVLRFTVPVGGAGLHHIAAAVQSYRDIATSGDTDFHVRWNDTVVLDQSLPPNAESGYTNTLEMAEGHTIDFVVGRGADNRLTDSCFKIQVLITPLPTPLTLEKLIEMVEQSPLPRNRIHPLLQNLDRASAFLAEEQLPWVVNQLIVFQQKVSAQVSRTNPSLAEEFINGAQEVINSITGMADPIP
jgi:hypothetical protein